MKKVLKWGLISLAAVILLAAAGGLTVLFMLSPARLTPLVNRFSNEFLDADVRFDSVNVSLFEEFPMLSVSLVGGEIISHAMRSDTAYLSVHPENIDTLISFGELTVSLNLRDLLRSRVNVRRIRLSQPIVNAYVSPSGRANWDIFGEPDPNAEQKEEESPLDINIDRFSIRGPAKVNFRSCYDSMDVQASFGRLSLRGKLTPDLEKLEIHRFVVVGAEVDYSSFKDSMFFKGSMGRVEVLGNMTLDTATFEINKVLLTEINADYKSVPDAMAFKGTFANVEVEGALSSDMARLEVTRLLLSEVEADYRQGTGSGFLSFVGAVNKIDLEGTLTLDTSRFEVDKFETFGVKFDVVLGESGDIRARVWLDSNIVETVEPRRVYNIRADGAVTAFLDNVKYTDSLPLRTNGNVLFNLENIQVLGFQDFKLTVANLPELTVNGELLLSADNVHTDLNVGVTALPLQSLLSLIPPAYAEETKKVRTNMRLSANAKINGYYDFAPGRLPTVVADFRIPGGNLTYRQSAEEEAKIDNFAIDASLTFDHAAPRRTGINVRNISLEAVGATLNGNLRATNLLDDPNVSMKLNGSANLRELMKFVPPDLGVTARGNITFNAEGTFLLSLLNERDLAKNNLVFQVSGDRVRFRLPQESISLLVERTTFELNTTRTRISRRTGEERRQITIDLKSDSARVRLPSRETVTFSSLELALRSSDDILSAGPEGTTVIPMGGSLNATTIQYIDVDSSVITFRDLKTNVRLRPSRENRSLPSIRFDAEARRLSARMHTGDRFGVSDATIALTAVRNDPEQQRTRREMTPHQLDSLQLLFPNVERDSLAAHARRLRRASREADELASADIDIRNTEIGTLLRAWTVDGSLKSRSGRLTTPAFPLRTRLQNVDVDFTTDVITVNNVGIRTGESVFGIKGKVEGIQRAMSRGRGLSIALEIKSDTLNIDELLTALYSGAALAEASAEERAALAAATDEDQLERLIQEQSAARENEGPQLVVIPSNISLDAKFDVSNGRFADIVLESLTGSLISRDRCLKLNNLAAITNVGEIHLTALYATRSKTDITFGLDLEFKDIQVEDFVRIVPAIDSMAPMLSSFQGIINAQIAATASLDSNMDVLLPTLNAACRIRGQNLVLMDGETFSEIARTLRFRNRERNLIDSISVEMLISDNEVQIFPFIMEMDRYRMAISGIQNLDMSFRYHVSVLRSPLPFRIGINISGDFDNMRIRPGRVRYRDTNMPTFVTVIDTTRINLRTQIDNFLQLGVDAARFSHFEAPPVDPSMMLEGGDLSAQELQELENMMNEQSASAQDESDRNRRRRNRR